MKFRHTNLIMTGYENGKLNWSYNQTRGGWQTWSAQLSLVSILIYYILFYFYPVSPEVMIIITSSIHILTNIDCCLATLIFLQRRSGTAI